MIPCTHCDGRLCRRIDRAIGDEKPHVIDSIETCMAVNNIGGHAADCPRTELLAMEVSVPLAA